MERVKKDDDMTSTAPSKESKEAEERKLQEVKNELDRAVHRCISFKLTNSGPKPQQHPVAPRRASNPRFFTGE